MNIIVNGGLHRYPVEFLKAGAHGYLDGIGSLAHSSYHYIDVIAWYLQLAPGDATQIKITLPHIFRVKDYLNIKGYKALQKLINSDDEKLDKGINLPVSVLNSELDFTFHLQLLNKDNLPIGLISCTSNHTTYTPRKVKYNPIAIDHAHDRNGGRMSQIYWISEGYLQCSYRHSSISRFPIYT